MSSATTTDQKNDQVVNVTDTFSPAVLQRSLQTIETLATTANPVPEPAWRSCCFSCEPRVLIYFTKITFSAVTLLWALYMISSNEDACNPNMSWYTGLVGMVAGSYIEQGSHIVKRK